MGVDWIPCRVDKGCSDEELREHVRREAMHFRTNGWSVAAGLDPRIRFSEAERERIRREYLELGPLHRRLLFKRDSHRVSVITSEVHFPVAWRIDAERTILPWELGERLAEWKGYREEVREGGHRPFLRRLYVFACLHDLVTVDLANLAHVVEHSRTASGGWAARPEVAALRDELRAAPLLAVPTPPDWPGGDEEAEIKDAERAFTRGEAAVRAWNDAVRRGNVRVRWPRKPLPFEPWIAARLGDGWFASSLF